MPPINRRACQTQRLCLKENRIYAWLVGIEILPSLRPLGRSAKLLAWVVSEPVSVCVINPNLRPVAAAVSMFRMARLTLGE